MYIGRSSRLPKMKTHSYLKIIRNLSQKGKPKIFFSLCYVLLTARSYRLGIDKMHAQLKQPIRVRTFCIARFYVLMQSMILFKNVLFIEYVVYIKQRLMETSPEKCIIYSNDLQIRNMV